MATDKRERQRANRSSRVAEAEEHARKAKTRSRVLTYGVLAAVVAVAIVGFAWLTSDDSDDDAAESESAGVDPADVTDNGEVTEIDGYPYGSGDCPAEDGSSGPAIDFSGPQPLCIDPAGEYVAVFDTSLGEIRVDLDTAATPYTVNNFVTLARWGYYDDTTVFRTDTGIDIVQGGSPHTESAADPGPGYTLTDEPTMSVDDTGQVADGPYSYAPGQLVMARRPIPDGAGAQYFFSTGENTSLLDAQGTYVVFGTTDDAGLAVLGDMIALDGGGAPTETITVNSVTIEG